MAFFCIVMVSYLEHIFEGISSYCGRIFCCLKGWTNGAFHEKAEEQERLDTSLT